MPSLAQLHRKNSDMTTQIEPFTAGGLSGDDLWRELKGWLLDAQARHAELYAADSVVDEDDLDADADDLALLEFAFRVTPASTPFARNAIALAASAGLASLSGAPATI